MVQVRNRAEDARGTLHVGNRGPQSMLGYFAGKTSKRKLKQQQKQKGQLEGLFKSLGDNFKGGDPANGGPGSGGSSGFTTALGTQMQAAGNQPMTGF